MKSNFEAFCDLTAENYNLLDKIARLKRAIDCTMVASERQEACMIQQLVAMRRYSDILYERINDLLDNEVF